MRATSDIVYGVTGQTLRHRVRSGQPSAATFAVYADDAADDDDPEFSGTATVDTVSTTLLSAAGASQSDPTLIELTSTAGIVAGRQYLIAKGGKREWVCPAEVLSGSIYTNAPLQNDYAVSGSTFKGCDVTAAVDATWVADSGNLSDPQNPDPDYRVIWTITIDGATRLELTFFDLVRGGLGHGVTMHDVESRLWNVLEDIPVAHRGDQGQRIIDAAWEDVQSLLAGQRVNDAAVRDAALIDQLLMKQIRLTFAINGFAPRGMAPDLAITLAREDMQRFFERHFVAGQVPMATTSNAAQKKSFRPWVK